MDATGQSIGVELGRAGWLKFPLQSYGRWSGFNPFDDIGGVNTPDSILISSSFSSSGISVIIYPDYRMHQYPQLMRLSCSESGESPFLMNDVGGDFPEKNPEIASKRLHVERC